MANTATVTAKIGPGNTVTAGAYTGVTSAFFNFEKTELTLVCDQGRPVFDITAATTFTLTLTSGVYTLTVS